MAYAFKHSNKVAEQVREIACEQVDKVLDAFETDSDFDRNVHTLRKASKKVRALLLLVRPNFQNYDAEIDAIRAIAGSFSVARDAAVMIETLDAIRDWAGGRIGEDDAAALADWRGKLSTRAGHLRQQMGEELLLSSARQGLEDLRQRAEDWRFARKGDALILPGLKSAYRKCRKAMDKALMEPSAERMHDWRKAAKAHWYHVRLLQRSAPAVLDGLADRLEHLGTLLGDHHNLAVLSDWLQAGTATADSAPDLVLRLIEDRQLELANTAFDLGRQLLAERPRALTRRLEHYWHLLD